MHDIDALVLEETRLSDTTIGSTKFTFERMGITCFCCDADYDIADEPARGVVILAKVDCTEDVKPEVDGSRAVSVRIEWSDDRPVRLVSCFGHASDQAAAQAQIKAIAEHLVKQGEQHINITAAGAVDREFFCI